MIKRLTWFTGGIVAGAASVVLMGRRIRRRVSDLAPVRVAERAVRRSRQSALLLRDAYGEGRAAMAQRERELKERLLGERPPESHGKPMEGHRKPTSARHPR